MKQVRVTADKDKKALGKSVHRFITSVAEAGKTALSTVFLTVICVLALAYFAGGQDNIKYTQGEINESAVFTLGVPLGSYPGRGMNLPIALNYSSAVWRIDYRDKVTQYAGVPTAQTITQAIYSQYGTAGWKSNFDLPVVEWPRSSEIYSYDGKPGGVCATYRIAKLTIHMPDGSTHELRKSDQPQNINYVDMSGTFYAVDGSRIRYDSTDADTGILYMPNGTKYSLDPGGSSITDKNGNTMTYSPGTGIWTDTLGRTFTNPLANPVAGSTTNYILPGISGTDYDEVPYQLKWEYLEDVLTPDGSNNVPDLRYIAAEYLPSPSSPAVGWPSYTNYPDAQSSAHGHLFESKFTYDVNEDQSRVPTVVVGKDQAQGQIFNPVVLSEIVLPDGTKYKFTYNEFGEINKVVYPTSAYETYDYETPPDTYDLYSDEPYIQAQRRITSKKLSTNGTGSDIREWKYSEFTTGGYILDQGGVYKVTAIIAPDNTRTEIYKYNPHAYNTKLGFTDSRTGAVIQKKIFSTSETGFGGTLLRREITQYDQTINPITISTQCGQGTYNYTFYPSRNPRPDKQVNLIFEGSGSALSQKMEFSYDSTFALTAGVDQTAMRNYAFAVVSHSSAESDPIGSIATGSLLKTTATIYLNDQNYRNLNILGLPIAVIISDASATVVSRSDMTYDESGYTYNGSPRGLPTTLINWDSTKGVYTNPNAYLTIHSTFDQHGNRTVATDAKGNSTTTTFDSTYHTFPVSVTSAVPDSTGTHGSSSAFTISTNYDFTTGLVLSVTDENNQTTYKNYEDVFLRPTKVTAPNGQQTIMEYGGVGSDSTRWVKVKSQIDDARWSEGKTYYDGIGRGYKTEKIESGGNVFSITEFDNMGRVKKTSNPFRNVSNPSCSTNLECTTRDYDDLGRVIKIKSPDNSEGETVYSLAVDGSHIGTVATVEDPAGKLRRGIVNGLGQTVRVDEPNSSNQLGTISSPNQATSYTYDALNNLATVTQGGQTRTFTYDSLSRLLSSANPESGTSSYTYDNNNNLASKTDSRGVATTFSYDKLNRIITRSYSGESGYTTPAVNYYYDNLTNAKRKLVKVSNSVSVTESTGFDAMGMVTSQKQTIDGADYTSSYVYNLRQDLVEETYPNTRKVRNITDNNGALSIVESKKNSNSGYSTYAGSFTYTAAGAVSSVQLGNGRWESMNFNSRLQPTRIALGLTPNATNLLMLDYTYGTTDNNGNVLSQTITVPTAGASAGFTTVQNYTYDSLNRLQQADEKPQNYTQTDCNNNPGKCWKQTFTYDRFGNRTFDEANTTTLPKNCTSGGQPAVCAADRKVLNPQISSSTNRIVQDQDGDSVNDYIFDAAGSDTRDALGRTFVYDAENKQVEAKNSSSQTLGTYYYDGDGRRVKKVVPGGETTIFVYDAASRLIAEYSSQPNPTPEVSYLTNDALGTPRVNTNENGAVIARHDYHPFGEDIASTQRLSGLGYGASSDDIRKRFTGYERDTETDLEYAQARYYAKQHGRFTSVDPILSSAEVEDPASWNRYVYAGNNPLRLVDPLGMWNWSPALGGDDSDDDLKKKQKDIQKDPNLTPAEKAQKIAEIERQLQMRAMFRQALSDMKTFQNHISAEYSSGDANEAFNNNMKMVSNLYGSERDGNGVIIGEYANAPSNVDGATSITSAGKVHIALVFNLQTPNSFLMSITLVHEGVHALQGLIWFKSGKLFNPNLASTEDGAYAFAVDYTRKVLDLLVKRKQETSQNAWYRSGGNLLYQHGWGEVDIRNARMQHLTGLGLYTYNATTQMYKLTPKGAGPSFPGKDPMQ